LLSGVADIGYIESATKPSSLIPSAPSSLLLRDGKSMLLLEHYVHDTSATLFGDDGANWNPFVTLVLPRARDDELIMQAVLALSGVHYITKSTCSDMASTTWSHYAQAVRGLKHQLTRQGKGDKTQHLRLLFMTILLSYVEVGYSPVHLRLPMCAFIFARICPDDLFSS